MTTETASMPPVVAVVVTHEPGDWFEEAIASLAEQDYPTLGVLVLDSSSGSGVAERVAAYLPAAIVRRVDPDMGYSEKANLVTGLVEGAAFYLFCHDDVALAADATSIMVKEAFRSNAAIVGAKTVQWSDHRRLLAVGSSVDKTGSISPFVEPGELDQEQHDRVRDVFFIPGACTLVRSDLFIELGGFDPEITYLGEDMDFCWRAQVAGARVMVAPDAVVRHVEALGERRRVDDRRRLQSRHRVRSLLACSGFLSLVFIVPLALTMSFVEALYALAHGHVSHARDVLGAWLWNLTHSGSLFRKRRQIAKSRKVSDFDIWRLQTRGSARLRSFTREQFQNDQRWQQVADRGRSMAGTMRGGSGRLIVLLLSGITLIYGFGSRHLISRGIPEFGEFVQVPDGWTAVLGGASDGLSSGASATGEVLLGVLQVATLGASSSLRYYAVLAAVPLGLFGMWRAARPLGSHRASATAVVVYAAIPFGLDALSVGSWPLLVGYACAPLVLGKMLRMSGLVPFGPSGGIPGPGVSEQSLVYQVLALGLLVGVAAAYSPAVILFAPVMALGILIGCLLTGQLLGGLRCIAGALVATLVALLLHAPYLLSAGDSGTGLHGLWGPNRFGSSATLSQIVRLDFGIHGSGLGWGFLLIGGLALLLGQGWRVAWAARAWGITLVAMGLAWVVAKDLLPIEMPALPFVLLVAGPAVAISAALVVVAVERDVSTEGFGWRQLLAPASVVICLALSLPIVTASSDGRWGMPRLGLQSGIEFIGATEQGNHRVLWLGDESLLPGHSWRASGGIALSVSNDGPPDLGSYFGLPDDQPGERITVEVERMLNNETSRAGRSLGVLGVRYIVLVIADAPGYAGGLSHEVPESTLQALSAQLDLTLELKTPAVMIFENAAWIPARAILTPELAAESEQDPLSLGIVADWGQMPGISNGLVTVGDTIYLGEDVTAEWAVRLGGKLIESNGVAFGYGQTFTMPASGKVTFEHDSSAGAGRMAALQVALFAALGLALLWATNRRSVWSPLSSPAPSKLTALSAPVDQAEDRYEQVETDSFVDESLDEEFSEDEGLLEESTDKELYEDYDYEQTEEVVVEPRRRFFRRGSSKDEL